MVIYFKHNVFYYPELQTGHLFFGVVFSLALFENLVGLSKATHNHSFTDLLPALLSFQTQCSFKTNGRRARCIAKIAMSICTRFSLLSWANYTFAMSVNAVVKPAKHIHISNTLVKRGCIQSEVLTSSFLILPPLVPLTCSVEILQPE